MVIRAAMTQTRNVYAPMPDSADDLGAVAEHLDEIRGANVAHHVDLIAQAASRGVKVIGLGELFTAPYFALHRNQLWRELAEDAITGPTVTTMRDTARRHAIVIIAPLYENDGDRRFNTAVIIDADGGVLGRTRKRHIPHGANESGAFDELFYYEPSDGAAAHADGAPGERNFFPVYETAAGRVGVSICYDRHFEGVVSSLARAGAQVVFSPAVTFGAKSRRLWNSEFEVDAARHRVFIGGSNRLGAEPPWGQAFFGDSHFVGPNGRLEDLSDDDRLVISDLDLEELSGDDPAGWDLARDSRPDIY